MGSMAPNHKPLKVLYHMHPNMETLDFTGPFEILSQATLFSSLSTSNGPITDKLFQNTVTAVDEETTTGQNLTLKRHIPVPEAYSALADYDVLVIPGGGTAHVLGGKTEPLGLIKAFAALPKRADGRVRVMLSVCTGSLFLAEAGVLDGLSATTHPLYYGKLKEIADTRGTTMVREERYVVNRVQEEKGLRIVTSGGVSCGLDSALWLIGEVAGKESRERTANTVQYAWREGVVM